MRRIASIQVDLRLNGGQPKILQQRIGGKAFVQVLGNGLGAIILPGERKAERTVGLRVRSR